MTIFNRLNISQFRNIENLSFNACDRVNLIYGANGSGKTSILEALHVLATGKSFRSTKTAPVIRNGSNELTVFAELSGGMRKRVAIARAIAMNPRYLFCDEPNSGLDPETGIIIDNLIKELTEEFNMTTIVNSHDMNSVLEIGDNVVFIYQGCKCWEGSKTEVLHTENEALNSFVFATNMARQIKRK